MNVRERLDQTKTNHRSSKAANFTSEGVDSNDLIDKWAALGDGERYGPAVVVRPKIEQINNFALSERTESPNTTFLSNRSS